MNQGPGGFFRWKKNQGLKISCKCTFKDTKTFFGLSVSEPELQ
jgi:hypothetical protein